MTLNIISSVVTNELVEFGKLLVEVQDFKKFIDHFRWNLWNIPQGHIKKKPKDRNI